MKFIVILQERKKNLLNQTKEYNNLYNDTIITIHLYIHNYTYITHIDYRSMRMCQLDFFKQQQKKLIPNLYLYINKMIKI